MNAETAPPEIPSPGYKSPYGQPRGLRARMASHINKLGQSGLPWHGLGLLADVRLLMQMLNKREWLEKLRASDDPDAQEFAAELLDDCDELETVDDAASRVQGLPDEKHALPAVETLERLDARAQDYERIRHVLVELGVLDASDRETPVADLVRAVLA